MLFSTVKKQSTWSRLQEYVPDNKAFYELSTIDILRAFNLDELYATGDYDLVLNESREIITIELVERD